jgi:hypothetical protein
MKIQNFEHLAFLGFTFSDDCYIYLQKKPARVSGPEDLPPLKVFGAFFFSHYPPITSQPQWKKPEP